MGIPHFSALSDKRKKVFLEHPEDFIYQEKVDGSNLKFKLDESFPWAMRKTVNGKVYTKPDDWGTDFWVTGFRAAHQAMINVRHMLVKPYMLGSPYNGGEILDMELLFADSPNTIVYSEDHNTIVIFSPPGATSFVTGTYVTLNDVPSTTDGFTIQRSSKEYEFTIVSLDKNPVDELEIEEFSIFDKARQMPLQWVGDFLVDKLANDTSSFSGVNLATPARMEGLVFKHKDGWMFKLVDKKWFTAQNTKNYEVRHWLFKSPRGHKNSVMDSFWAYRANGHSVDVAVTMALKRLDEKWGFYHPAMQGTQEPHIHLRNLESFASIRHQLYDYAKNGIPDDTN
jgi:hypothetical protein